MTGERTAWRPSSRWKLLQTTSTLIKSGTGFTLKTVSGVLDTPTSPDQQTATTQTSTGSFRTPQKHRWYQIEGKISRSRSRHHGAFKYFYISDFHVGPCENKSGVQITNRWAGFHERRRVQSENEAFNWQRRQQLADFSCSSIRSFKAALISWSDVSTQGAELCVAAQDMKYESGTKEWITQF